MGIGRSQVIQALTLLGIDPQTTEEVVILQNKIVIRRRDIITIDTPVDMDEHSDHSA